ncbi:MAG: HAD-IIIC family phosphatase [Dysgonamonadaceae bacterium]|jgi:FkbH-like protein|nr:HAD-IIIC family phosphatase [Dysgonamonadaceae bacterium]
MKYFIFRNYTIEPFFKDFEAEFSGYEDISVVPDADRYVWWYFAPYKINNQTAAGEIENYGNLLEFTFCKIDANKLVFVFTMQPIFCLNYQTKENTVNGAIINYNQKIRKLSEKYKNLKIVDFAEFVKMQGTVSLPLIDWKFYFFSQMPLNPKLANDFSHWFARQIETIELKRKKCIVLDLDNTLWGGILGEDGAEGIKIDETYPGNCFLFFQEYLLELVKNGIILTVCSKNNEQDVIDLWNDHPNLKIRKEQLAAWRINWNNKVENIREIAAELNIGLDSLVFVDDNPTERELVRQLLPQVETPDFPEKPYLFPEFVKMLTDRYFSIYEITKEDREKTQQYKENTERKQFESKFTNFDDYLRSLEIELTIENLSEMNIARFAQMTQKTNQFNLATKRYTESDLRDLDDNGAQIFGLRVKDRFGDNGLTGLLIITNYETAIDTFLLSCRILGKGIENVFLQYVLMRLKEQGMKTISAKYIKTLKNCQVENFYEQNGFILNNYTEEIKNYLLSLRDINYTISDIYKITEI